MSWLQPVSCCHKTLQGLNNFFAQTFKCSFDQQGVLNVCKIWQNFCCLYSQAYTVTADLCEWSYILYSAFFHCLICLCWIICLFMLLCSCNMFFFIYCPISALFKDSVAACRRFCDFTIQLFHHVFTSNLQVMLSPVMWQRKCCGNVNSWVLILHQLCSQLSCFSTPSKFHGALITVLCKLFAKS